MTESHCDIFGLENMEGLRVIGELVAVPTVDSSERPLKA